MLLTVPLRFRGQVVPLNVLDLSKNPWLGATRRPGLGRGAMRSLGQGGRWKVQGCTGESRTVNPFEPSRGPLKSLLESLNNNLRWCFCMLLCYCHRWTCHAHKDPGREESRVPCQ